MIETHRCEGESKVCSDVRTSIKKQYQTQYKEAKEAMNEGSDYLIIGRPLTSGNPKENIKKIIKSLE